VGLTSHADPPLPKARCDEPPRAFGVSATSVGPRRARPDPVILDPVILKTGLPEADAAGARASAV